MSKLPDFLKKNDTVALVATAKQMDFSLVENAQKHLENWGFRVITGESAHASFHSFAGDDKLRANDLQTQLNNPDVKAILCLRGGYGTGRIMDRLDFSEFVRNPKWIVGYSDVTILQNHILQNYNIASLHAEMPLNLPLFPHTNESLESLHNALFGHFEDFCPEPSPLNRVGTATGELAGGNLSMLCSTLGSVSEVDTCGKILFIEDVGEYLYAIDRMMLTLKRAGKLKNLAGLVVGQFTRLQDNDIPFGKTAFEIIAEHVAEYDYPTLFNIPAGHCEINKALVFGGKYAILNNKFSNGIIW